MSDARLKFRHLLYALALAPAAALAASGDDLEDVPEPPEIPAQLQDGTPIEPDVTIIHRQDAVIEEYRVHGMLYAVKVTPAVGPAYYLIDRDGDGRMESRIEGLAETLTVPQWVIFSW